ncbi:MAG: galactokinase [Rhodospirillales bacterium]|jgi:D-glycero-alpha-D-manno-heptose-7-phosphate kinase|nr:galactokinase [Rhodospirillales bacterium]MBT5076760.1 galactokinase [Rhodospirillales bacterium]MBT5113799.1 galactokinase [Rhodospirillales bacterium]MBT5672327.1 galactokinase [Rhodospirillales bacterium]MBT6186004.1 galactokinase [Rhodospirillales bacterium]
MIIARSPLRISLGGGGTDLPSYYQDHEGFLIAAAIDKYVYITIHQTFVEEMIVKYAELERVESAQHLQHSIIREAFDLMGLDGRYMEVSSMADIPAGTGLGSSGSFCTALLTALHQYTKNPVDAEHVAEQACHIEIERLGEPIGKQDQYVASFGGANGYHFSKDGKVEVCPIKCSNETLYNLEENLLLFFTGYSRRASSILEIQDNLSRSNDRGMIDNLHYVKQLGKESLAAIESDNLADMGRIMDEHWQHKKSRAPNMSNTQVDEYYAHALKNGAMGGKLVGAGGGGFLMFYTEDRMRLRSAMSDIGLKEVRFQFDYEGSKVISS